MNWTEQLNSLWFLYFVWCLLVFIFMQRRCDLNFFTIRESEQSVSNMCQRLSRKSISWRVFFEGQNNRRKVSSSVFMWFLWSNQTQGNTVACTRACTHTHTHTHTHTPLSPPLIHVTENTSLLPDDWTVFSLRQQKHFFIYWETFFVCL